MAQGSGQDFNARFRVIKATTLISLNTNYLNTLVKNSEHYDPEKSQPTAYSKRN